MFFGKSSFSRRLWLPLALLFSGLFVLSGQETTARLVGNLVALGPKLDQAQFSEEERTALIEAFQKGFSYEEGLPEEVTSQFEAAREALRAHFFARNVRGEEEAIGADMARILGFSAFDFLGVPPQAFSQEEIQAITEGFTEGLTLQEIPPELRVNFRQVFNYLDAEAAPHEMFLGELILSHERALFEELRQDPEVEYAEDGLHWKILNPGSTEPPEIDDSVVVHYIGRLGNRSIFDSSYQREEPTQFALNRVIPGFSRGLQKIGKGGRIEIYIPTRLAYDDQPPPGANIDPLDTLIFEAEIIEIVKDDS